MNTSLKQFINTYIQLSENELDEITGSFFSKNITRGNYVLKPGEVCKDLVFVHKGCLRMYYLDDGVEVSVWFAFSQSSAIEMYSFISQSPTNYFIQAIEDSEVWCLPKPELEQLYQSHPNMQVMMRKFWEDVILHLINRFTALQRDSAEQRYLDLLQTPAYLETIPQKYLASFIGVTPTSLSRIRKQILKSH